MAADLPIFWLPDFTGDNLQKQSETVITMYIDSFAQTWGYDSILSAASYANSTISQFVSESKALIAWRDQVWIWAAGFLGEVLAGNATMPGDIDSLIALVPTPPERPTQ